MEAALVSAASRFMVQNVSDLLQLEEKLKAITASNKTKMKKLKELSTIIDKVIQDVDSRPLIDAAVKNLLTKLKYLAYDLEDVVDCYDTKVLQKQRSKTFLRPVRYFFSSHDNQIVFKSRVGGMIKAITESLDSILLQKSILEILPQGSIRMSELSLHRETHSRNSLVVIGREPEKNMIVDMLTKDDDVESRHSTLKVITIVGMGGLGKTTLAQLVFNDEKVKAHFASSKMWTVVGAEFDPAKIMKSVLQLATGAPVNISEIELVRQNLETALSGKRFLLVLDDVWNEDQEKWEVLKATLICGAKGSKILVTTRSQKVSSIMGSSNTTTHQIQQLSKDDCLSLFQQFAFGDNEADDHQNLMEIGGKIVEKCGGVPLAAKSLGSMLRGTRDETYWSSVLNSEIWQLQDKEQKVLAVLKLSYDTLPPQSKKCFAFGSLFPKDYRMQKDELIKLWIANYGFIHSEGNFDAETVANRVFDDLVSRSFFKDDRRVTKCTMHDLMHDLARSMSENVYWNVEDSVEDIGNRTYHLHLYLADISKITQALDKKPLYLRTLILNCCKLSLNGNLLKIDFSELKFLRVLDLSNNEIKEVPTSIGNLIYLRYLNLSSNCIEVLPDSITLLPNLKYLNLSWNMELQELPKDLGNMQSLRDLNCRRHDFQDFRLTHMPRGLSRLTDLRSLPLFVAGDGTDACPITELEKLKLHGEMDIIFSENFTNYSCGGLKILKNKDLNKLCIKFNGSEKYDEAMLDDLCPNTSLKKLCLKDYESRQFPAWLMESQLPNLVEVSLKCCCGCEHIPPFGDLQFLKKLELCKMDGITQMGAEFHGDGGFPSLQELCLTRMDNLEAWSKSDGDDKLFPSLQLLRLSDCLKLKIMPRLPTIQHLEISCCRGSLLSCIGSLTSLSDLKLDKMHDMTFFPSGYIRNLTSLEELQITECRQLQSLPGDEMQHLKLLRLLTIKGCPSIILQLEELVQILNSVQEFQIQICGNTVDLRGQLQSLHTLKELCLRGAHGYKPKYGIAKLEICCCDDELDPLMTAEPTSSVLEKLYIDDFSNLRTLPHWLQHLKSLSLLSIENCPRLQSVPDLKNLPMLKSLRVFDCPELERRCEKKTGKD
ncbi:putative disease resistance protein RGA3 [Zingiber officinale]|nr:putative disease resistance protein RGA3 [Zingiber officinale]